MTKEEVIQNFRNKKMTAAEAAKAAGVSKYTIYGWSSDAKRARKSTRAKKTKTASLSGNDSALNRLKAENARLKTIIGELYSSRVQ